MHKAQDEQEEIQPATAHMRSVRNLSDVYKTNLKKNDTTSPFQTQIVTVYGTFSTELGS